MWYFLRGTGVGDEEDDDHEAALEARRLALALALREETEELQAKLDAMRMADYREQLRASVAASKVERVAEEVGAGDGDAMVAMTSEGLQNFQHEDNSVEAADVELDDMYDFSRFVPASSSPAQASPAQPGWRSQSPRQAAKAEGLGQASPATPSSPSSPPPPWAPAWARSPPPRPPAPSAAPSVVPLAELSLAELEAELQRRRGSKTAAAQQQPQEPPGADPLDGLDKTQVLELVHLTEELTDALEAREIELVAARARIEEQEHLLSAERARACLSAERCACLEAQAQAQALRSRGNHLQWRHLEV